MGKATIVKIGLEKEVKTKNGLRWKYPIELSDGIKNWSSLQDKQNPFKEGMEIEYELKTGEYPEIQIKRPKKPRSGGGQKTDYSKEKVIKALEFAVAMHSRTGLSTRVADSLKTADEYLDWLNKKGV